jgi:phage major head subunit gpT-like protein
MPGLVNPSVLAATRVAVEARIAAAYRGVSENMLWYNQIATTIPGSGSGMTLYLEQTLPRMRKWISSRNYHGIKRVAQSLTYEAYEDSIKIGVDDLNDDNLQVYNAIIAGLGRAARLWPNDMMYNCITAGSTATCVDGQPFFNASHPLEGDGITSGTVQSNLHTGMALTAANYGTVRLRARKLKGEDNKPLNVGMGKLLLAIPPDLEDTARRIVVADSVGYLSNNSSTATDPNIYKGTADILVIPELAIDSATTWYLIDPNWDMKPFIFGLREEPNRVISLDQPTSEGVFERNEVRYGVKGRCCYGYGLWQMAHKCTA